MRNRKRFSIEMIVSALMLVLSIALSVLWQWQGRAHQQLDIGAPLDDGAALNFHDAETRTDDPTLTFRWSRASSEMRLWALPRGTLAILTLSMFPPHGSKGQVTLSVAGQPLSSLTLADSLRTYRILVRIPDDNEVAIGITGDGRTRASDPRVLGAGIDRVALDTISGPNASALATELWSAPFLPAGMLLLALCAWLLSIPKLLVGGLPALTLTLLALIDHLLPAARLRCASYPFAIAITIIMALALIGLLRRIQHVWPSDDNRARIWMTLIFIATVVLAFAPTIKGDGIGYYVYLHSITMDGDVNFGNDYQNWPAREARGYTAHTTATGYYVNYFSIGPALLWSPLYGAAHVIMVSGRAFGLPWLADGYAEPYFTLTTFGSAVAGLVLMFGGYQICRRWVSPPIALLAVSTTFLGSNLLYYTMREGGFAHGLSAATTTLYLLAWLRLEECPSIRRWAALGIAAGFMMLTYWLSAIVLVLPVCTGARLLVAALRYPSAQRRAALARLLGGSSIALLITALLFSPQMIAWKQIFGVYFTIPQGAGFVTPRSFEGAQMLFAPLHGLLPWTPALFFGAFSLVLLWWQDRYRAAALLLALLAYFAYNAWLPDWHGSGAFGLRRLTLLGPWCMLGLALLYDRLRRWRPLLPIVPAALMVGWATCVMIRYDLALIPHQPASLHKMSPVAFYLSREIFPLWAVSGWINHSYILGEIRALFSTGWNIQFVAIGSVMILATWAVAWAATEFVRTT